MLLCLILFKRSFHLFSLLKLVFLFAIQLGWFPLICLPDCRSILLYYLFYCWFLLVYFLISVTVLFSSDKYFLIFFYIFKFSLCSFIWPVKHYHWSFYLLVCFFVFFHNRSISLSFLLCMMLSLVASALLIQFPDPLQRELLHM